jgi:dissimilatory sulfite reductase (desulfoviridin) alpha/beta subunit
MTADIIFTAILLSPSNTSSLQQSHNGFQKTVGSEQDFYQDEKIKYAIKIYNKYDDERAEILENSRRKIKFIPIEDVDQIIQQ